MKAVQLHRYGTPDVLTYETVADLTPKAGEILIKVESASVNYSDVARRSNAIYPFPTMLPFIPGSEVAGVVEALGEGVTFPPIGTPVFALAGTGSNGYAEYVVTSAQQVIPIPQGVSFDQAATLPVAGTTAMMIIREVGQLKHGESILIQGASGGVGSYAIQIAKLLGAGTIIGATSSSEKMDNALKIGADYAIDYTQPNWADRVREITNGRGVDVILEMNGGNTFSQALACLAPFGRIVVYGISGGEPLVFDNASILHFFYNPSLNQSIHVFNLGIWFGMRPEIAAKAMGDLIGYVASGQIQVHVNHVLPLAQASEAHRMLEERRTTGKIVLKPWITV
ncbi:MAG: NADPH:quinone oxidoreductase family protein [bacterium]|nr:NADPH:quinone oxidoreductase family protein [bacterium]